MVSIGPLVERAAPGRRWSHDLLDHRHARRRTHPAPDLRRPHVPDRPHVRRARRVPAGAARWRHAHQARRPGGRRRRPRPGRRGAALARPARRQPRRRRPRAARRRADGRVHPGRGGRLPGVLGLGPGSRSTWATSTVTAVPARHGPEGAEPLSGVVTGFVLQAPGQPDGLRLGRQRLARRGRGRRPPVPGDRPRGPVRRRCERRPVRRRAAHARRAARERRGRPAAHRPG